MRPDGSTFEIVHTNSGQQEVFGTTDLFHRQIGSTLGIPAKYYDQMRKLKPELLAENVNAWFADREQSYMIRSMDYGNGRVARALLSDRYRRIDNMEIASVVLPLFAGQPDMQVMSCEVTENRMYLKIVNKRLEMDVVPGDTVQGGVIISNSEVGLGAVSVQPLLYRLVCTNGMVVNDLGERRTHVGRAAKAVEDSFTLYSDEALIAEDKAFMLKLRDITMAAIEETRFGMVVERLRESTQVKITGRVQDVIELTGVSNLPIFEHFRHPIFAHKSIKKQPKLQFLLFDFQNVIEFSRSFQNSKGKHTIEYLRCLEAFIQPHCVLFLFQHSFAF